MRGADNKEPEPAMAGWFTTLRSAPAKWRRRNRTERILLMEAFALLGLARLLVLTVPFRWLARTLGAHMRESAQDTASAELETARMIGQAVVSAAGNTPWESVCLPQAVAGLWMLKRRGIAATLYLGVVKTDRTPERMAAHAWLRCGDRILTGAAGHTQFTIVAMFS